jgi:hypothetical protein
MRNHILPDRSKIDIHDGAAARRWAKHFGISSKKLTELVERVGNSAAAVRKENQRVDR